MQTKFIAEIGINHNGDLDIAKKLIDISSFAGCQYVKLQKRNPDVSVPEEQKIKLKDTIWGEMTYLDYKKKIEFGYDEYKILFEYCKAKNIKLFASVWDIDSAKFMKNYTNIVKIPSAKATDKELLKYCRYNFDFKILSTGMTNENQIIESIKLLCPNVVMHTNSAYPTPINDIHLTYIKQLKKNHNVEVGYSGHEIGIIPTLISIAMGATWIERHITLDKTMWGSDQTSSINPEELIKLVKEIKIVENCIGNMKERKILDSEKYKLKSLRGLDV